MRFGVALACAHRPLLFALFHIEIEEVCAQARVSQDGQFRHQVRNSKCSHVSGG